MSAHETFARAEHQWQIGNIPEAEKLLRQTLAEEPEAANAMALLALCRLKREDKEEAAQLAKRAAEIEPENDFVLRVLGMVFEQQKQYSQAQEAIESAIANAPEEPFNHVFLANFLERRSKHKQAEDHYQQALALDPDNMDALVGYGDFLISTAREEEAAPYLQRASEIEPDNVDLILALGDLAFRRGDMNEARERALWILSINSENPVALALLAKVKLRRNPVMGLWFKWALFMGRFDGKQKLFILLGLYLAFQVTYRVFLRNAPLASNILLFAWLGFCLLTWIAPYVLARTIKAETKTVTLNKDY